MGTQQILLIVLSVIIVGIAVAVGITMFNQQSFNSNRNACISDLNMFATQAVAWYKTPPTHGGKGSSTVVAGDLTDLVEWIGFTENVTNDFATGNGQYDATLTTADLKILAAGVEGADPELTLLWTDCSWTIDLSATST